MGNKIFLDKSLRDAIRMQKEISLLYPRELVSEIEQLHKQLKSIEPQLDKISQYQNLINECQPIIDNAVCCIPDNIFSQSMLAAGIASYSNPSVSMSIQALNFIPDILNQLPDMSETIRSVNNLVYQNFAVLDEIKESLGLNMKINYKEANRLIEENIKSEFIMSQLVKIGDTVADKLSVENLLILVEFISKLSDIQSDQETKKMLDGDLVKLCVKNIQTGKTKNMQTNLKGCFLP